MKLVSRFRIQRKFLILGKMIMSDFIDQGNEMSTDTSFFNITHGKNRKNASCVKVIGFSMVAVLVVICVSAVTAVVTVHLMETNRPGLCEVRNYTSEENTEHSLKSFFERYFANETMGTKGSVSGKGEEGIKGEKGNVGENGQPGIRGPTGKKGENGEKGTKGNKGPTGEIGEKGQMGEKGPVGNKGKMGEKGEKGLLGAKGHLGLNGPNGEKGSIGDIGQRGDKGPIGDKGENGDRGQTGNKGPVGEKGSIGDKGQRGDNGTTGSKGDNGKFGDKGSVGDKGQTGNKGPTGEPGRKGQSGDKGANGEKGLKGSSGESGKVPVVVFRARNVSPDSDLSNTVIKFPNVAINSGSGYDKSTGKFTAPQAGTYLFILQICPEDDHSVLMTLRANDNKFGVLNQKNNHDDGPCTSTSAVTVLSKGEEVWVYCESASSGDSVWNANENGNSFSGVLLHTGTL